jgi:hypothetical protein
MYDTNYAFPLNDWHFDFEWMCARKQRGASRKYIEVRLEEVNGSLCSSETNKPFFEDEEDDKKVYEAYMTFLAEKIMLS